MYILNSGTEKISQIILSIDLSNLSSENLKHIF